jgi:precorrin-4/cobalt-precorrin-4 C11-methyltransferase
VAEQMRRLERNGIAYTVTPGVPSFSAAAAALGRELTVPEVAQSVVLTRVGGRASKMPDGESLDAFARTGATLAIHLAVHRASEIAMQLLPYYGGECPVAIVARASWPDQQIVRTSLKDLAEAVADAGIERTAVILVGEALGPGSFRDSALYDPTYDRRFRGSRA